MNSPDSPLELILTDSPAANCIAIDALRHRGVLDPSPARSEHRTPGEVSWAKCTLAVLVVLVVQMSQNDWQWAIANSERQ